MIRILGIDLENNKKIYIALTSIYGIGLSTSKKILNILNIDFNLKVKDLNETNISNLRDFLEKENFKLEGNLRRFIKTNIARLIAISSFRGRRHLKGLPTRGQRTRTNSKSSRKLSLSITKN